MNYFLVFQNQSYKEEREGGYLWAPQKNDKGQTFHHWTDMKLIRKNDIIFNSYMGKLVSVIIAKEHCKEHDKPNGLKQFRWEKKGWLVNGEYIDLAIPIRYKDYLDEILRLQGKKYAPFNKRGGNTGYLFRVSKELADFLFNIIELTNGLSRERFKLEEEETFIKNIENGLDLMNSLDKTEKETVIKSRIGHSSFKKALLAIDKKCKICGMSDERFLIASHIKPWSKSNNKERLDINNGLLLCPNHDTLFDKRFITFDEKGKIMIKDAIDEKTKDLLNIDDTIQINLNNQQQVYMSWHREQFLREERNIFHTNNHYE